MATHTHIYRAVPGAGWACIHCGRPTVTPPPKEQRAAYAEKTKKTDAPARVPGGSDARGR